MPYKRTVEAIRVLGSLADIGVSGVFAGPVRDAEVERLLEDMALPPNVVVRPGAMVQDEVERGARESDAILVTQSSFMNSGGVYLALSLGLPVIIARTRVTEELQRDHGADWIRLFDGDLSATALVPLLGPFHAEGLDLSKHAPAAVSEAHAVLYRELAGGVHE